MSVADKLAMEIWCELDSLNRRSRSNRPDIGPVLDAEECPMCESARTHIPDVGLADCDVCGCKIETSPLCPGLPKVSN